MLEKEDKLPNVDIPTILKININFNLSLISVKNY